MNELNKDVYNVLLNYAQGHLQIYYHCQNNSFVEMYPAVKEGLPTNRRRLKFSFIRRELFLCEIKL
jgi:hypothetical protein